MERSSKTDIFEKDNIVISFIKLVIPCILSQVITIIYNYADTWYIGQTKNNNGVAAMTICMPIFVLLIAIANLFGIGGSSLIARLLGKKREEVAKNVFAFSLYGSIIIALIYGLVILTFFKPIAFAIGGTQDTLDYIYKYSLIAIIIGAIPTVLTNTFGHLVRSVGASKEASIGMALGGLINIALDPLFMFVILPKGNEVIGAAIATLVSNIISCIYFIIYISKHKEISVFTLNPKDIRLTKRIIANVLFIGFPAALGTTLAMVSNIFANKLMTDYGTFAQAGLGIAKKANTLAFNFCMGITQGMLPFIAYNFSSRNLDRMKKGMLLMTVVALISALLFMTFFLFKSKDVIKFFIEVDDTIKYGTTCLKLIAYAVPLCSLSFSATTIFQATGMRVFSFILSTLRKGLLDIPLMYLFKSQIGMKGIMLATPVAEVISVIVAGFLLLLFLKKIRNLNINKYIINAKN